MRCQNSVVSGTKDDRMLPSPDGDEKVVKWREGWILRATLINGNARLPPAADTRMVSTWSRGPVSLPLEGSFYHAVRFLQQRPQDGSRWTNAGFVVEANMQTVARIRHNSCDIFMPTDCCYYSQHSPPPTPPHPYPRFTRYR